MSTQPILAASILAADFTHLGHQIQQAEAAGVDWIHIDVMDGRFVPNLTIGPMVVQACRRVTDLPLHVHLMTKEPESLLGPFSEAGADSLTVHVETCPHLDQTLRTIRSLGLQAGVTLNPSTPIAMIEEVMDLADLVLVMTVNPGFGGQTMITRALKKVARAREMRDQNAGCSALIEVDGGVNPKTAPMAAEAGAEVFIAGTAIFRHPGGIEAGVSALRSALVSGVAGES
jgi:ribulose-phosphate 3-epimerase